MPGINTCRSRIEAACRAGAEKVQCVVVETEKHTISFEGGNISLFRTAKDLDIQLSAIFSGRRGMLSVNKDDAKEIESEIQELLASAVASPADSAYDIAPFQDGENIGDAVKGPDPEQMFRRIEELLASVKSRYPEISFRTAWLSFLRETKYLQNSNKLVLSSRSGRYELLVLFCSSKGGKTSTFNFFSGYSKDLGSPLLEWGGADRLLKESVEHAAAVPIKGKFLGDIIVSPECVGEFVRFMTNHLRDGKIISGTSVYKDKLGALVSHPEFTLRSVPLSEDIATGYFIAKDGFKAENLTIVEKGVLRSFLLGQYAASKTGFPYARNDGECYMIEAGKSEFNELVGKIKRGLLVTRFSGAEPNEKGDFSGIAKNSFYIEDGAIKYPVSETMISGNIPAMMLNIKSISRECVNSGDSIYPWVSFSGITISGK